MYTTISLCAPVHVPIFITTDRAIITSLSSQRPGFNVWEVHLGFVVDKLHRRSFSPSISIFPGQLPSQRCSIQSSDTPDGPQHTMMTTERSVHYTLTTAVPTTTDRPGLQRTQPSWQQTFTSRTTNTSVCH